MPRQPVDEHRRLVTQEGQRLQDHLLVAADHAVRIDHALRRPRRAGREQDLGDIVGRDLRVAPLDLDRRDRREHRLERAALSHDFDCGPQRRVDCPRETRAIRDEYEPGREEPEDVLERAEVARHERVGRRNRRMRHADVLRSERQEQVLDAVARENREGPIRGQMAIEQRLTQAAHFHERLAVGQASEEAAARLDPCCPWPVCPCCPRWWSPAAVPGEQRAVGRVARPVLEAIGQHRGIVSERLHRPEHDRTVRPLVDCRREIAEPDLLHGLSRACHRWGQA